MMAMIVSLLVVVLILTTGILVSYQASAELRFAYKYMYISIKLISNALKMCMRDCVLV